MSHTENYKQTNAALSLRLTALWALSESALGGLMHAFQAPFTGLFLGGFAVVIITLIAHQATHKSKAIMTATTLVLMIKAVAAPHSPFTAYIAVAFQGLLGAGLYGGFGLYKLSAGCFGMIALLESAIQRLLMMTLVFGKNIWEALDVFVHGILKELHIAFSGSASYYLMSVYAIIYIMVGWLVGTWAFGFWHILQVRSAAILEQYHYSQFEQKHITKKKRSLSQWWPLVSAVLFMMSVFLWQGATHKALMVVLRTVAGLLFIFMLANPILKWLLRRWITKQGGHQTQVQSILSLLPELKNYVRPSWQMTEYEGKIWRRMQRFTINLIVLSLYNHKYVCQESNISV